MEYGKKPRGDFRVPGSPKVTKVGILVDMHRTLVVPTEGRTQVQLVQEQAREVLGIKSNESYRSLARRMRAMRARVNKLIPPESRHGAAYWGFFNTHFYGCSMEKAVELSRRLTTGTDLYEMPDDRRRFFTWLFEEKFPADRATLIIASNSDHESVDRLLKKIGMKKYFPDGSVFTPELCDHVGKPSLQYWRRALAMMNVSAPEALMFGNSGDHDTAIAHLGVDVAWLRDNEEIALARLVRKQLGRQVSHVLPIDNLAEAQAAIDATFICKR